MLFNDVASGSVAFKNRKKGNELINVILNGEVNYISVSSIDRLGRSTIDILSTIEFFNTHNVTLRVDNLGIESITKGKPNSVFKLIISVMSNVSEMERETLLERQREGIALGKAKGLYKGRVRGTTENREEFLAKYKDVIKYLKQGQSLRIVAKLTNTSLGTVQKVKRFFTLIKNK